MNIERRRRWIEEIWAAVINETDRWNNMAEDFQFGPEFEAVYNYRKRLLSLLRRLRRCPECRGSGTVLNIYEPCEKDQCPTCKGTGRL